jgi:stearoyl-CoA desaturase (Delta-9 desaturase)
MALLFALLSAAAVTQLAILATTVYLHRALSHRAVTLAPGVRGAFRLVTWITTGIRPRQWVAVHRKHHAFSDEQGDPHSPVLLGYLRVQFGNVGLYRRVANDRGQVARYARDLPPDAWDRVLLDRAWLGLGIGIGILVLILGPWLGLLAAGVHTVAYLLLSAAINAIGHRFGARPHPNIATNNQWLAFLTWGEGLHNNHHAAPTASNFALDRGQIDPAWPLIRLLRRLGWATVRHDQAVIKEPRAPARAA